MAWHTHSFHGECFSFGVLFLGGVYGFCRVAYNGFCSYMYYWWDYKNSNRGEMQMTYDETVPVPYDEQMSIIEDMFNREDDSRMKGEPDES